MVLPGRRHRLLDDLRQHEFFKARELVPLCMAHEGYKQPQQRSCSRTSSRSASRSISSSTSTASTKSRCRAINNQQRLDISMPSAMHLDPLVNLVNQATLTPEKLQSLAAISQYKERINYLVGRLQHNRIAAINFVLERLHRSATASYQAEVARVRPHSPRIPPMRRLILATPSVTQRDEAKALAGRREKLVRSFDADADDALGTRHPLLSRPAAEPVLHEPPVQRRRSQSRAIGCVAVQDRRREGLSPAGA